MKNKYRKIAKLPIVVGFILFLSLGSLIVYAATNASDKKSNDLQLGILKGDIKEEFTETSEVSKDTDVVKKVSVENTGTTTLFVRVMLFPEIVSTSSKILPANIGEQITLTEDTNNGWENGGDGYYYYTKKLAVGETTPNLIESVKINSANVTSEYTDATLTIYTKSETISTVGYAYRQSWWGDASVAPTTPSELVAIDATLSKIKE